MAGLIESEAALIKGCRGQHSDRSRDHGGFIRKNISEHVLGYHNVELLRILHKLHGTVINQHIRKLNLRIICGHLMDNLSPESGGIQNICLIYAGHLFPALSCNFKSGLCNAADFILVVLQRIHRSEDAVLLFRPAIAEIQTSGQLTDDDEIKFPSSLSGCKRAGSRKLREQIGGTQIGIQSECLPDCQKSCLRTLFGRKLIPGRGFRISPDGAHQNGIAALCNVNGFLCQRNAVTVYGAPSHQNIRIMNGMSVLLTDTIQYLSGFGNNFRADSVSADYCNLHLHRLSSSASCDLC